MIDESTYGFSKPDAEQLVGMIGMADVEFEEMKPLPQSVNNTNAIVDIRISGTTFQYTRDGTNWVDWHTGSTCP